MISFFHWLTYDGYLWCDKISNFGPGEGAEVSSARSFELEELAQNMETLYMLQMTSSVKHQLQYQHLEVDQVDTLHDQIPAQDPTEDIYKIT